MSAWERRLSAPVAWTVFVVTTVSATAGIVLDARMGSDALDKFALGSALMGVMFPAVGAVILTRQPGNLIAWIMCFIGFTQGVDTFNTAYGHYTLVFRPGSGPGGEIAAWLNNWDFAPGITLLLIVLPLIFPSGRLPSPRWRIVVWLAALEALLFTVPFAVATWSRRGPDILGDVVPNPSTAIRIASGLQPIALLLGLALAACSAYSLIARFRRAHGREKLQLKWITFAVAAQVVCTVLVVAPINRVFGLFFAVVWAPLVPLAIGISILRYRLYDIDRIISRTLVYGVLTAGLATTYFGLVVGLQEALRSLSGGSDLAVVLTTLVVAALFLPARKRLQDAVDRRFNRRVYDAARTVDAFSSRLRQQIDLDTLRYELLAVVDETMAPVHTALWLRAPGGSS